MPAPALRWWVAPSIALTLVGFVAGLHLLMHLRLTTGDLHPPYSSFRSDPLGVQALHDALGELPGASVRRLLRPLGESDGAPPGALIFAAAPEWWCNSRPAAAIADLAAWARRGGRIIVALPPGTSGPERPRGDRKEASVPPDRHRTAPGGRPAGKHPPAIGTNTSHQAGPPTVSLFTLWGLHLEGPEKRPARRYVSTNTPDRLPWTSAAAFRTNSSGWRVLYTCEGRPVVVERDWNGGTVVFATDSYFLSNEAMLRHRRPELLAAVLGPGPTWWFDETHLGLVERPGLRDYVRRLGLDGVVGTLLVLAALVVWRKASPPLPPEEPAADAIPAARAGLERREGFLHLLRRHLPPARLPEVWLAEWRRTAGPAARRLAPEMERCLAAAGNRPPLEVCRQLHSIAHRRETTQ